MGQAPFCKASCCRPNDGRVQTEPTNGLSAGGLGFSDRPNVGEKARVGSQSSPTKQETRLSSGLSSEPRNGAWEEAINWGDDDSDVQAMDLDVEYPLTDEELELLDENGSEELGCRVEDKFHPESTSEVAGKKILIITSGSRGDIQPHVATAVPFMTRGLKVGIITNMEHEALVKSVPGVEFFSNGTNFEEFFTGNISELSPARALDENDPGLYLKVYYTWRASLGGREMKVILETIDAFKPDALLISGPCHDEMTGWIPRVTRIPVLQIALMPTHFSRWEPPSPGVPKLPWGQNMKWTERSKSVRIDVLVAVYAETIKNHSGMDYPLWFPRECEELIPFGGGTREQRAKSDDVLIYAWADFHKKRTDPSTMVYVGYPFLSASHTSKGSAWGGEDTKRLETFLVSGKTPAYIGYGSMSIATPELVTTRVVTAAKIAKCRAVILGGYAGLSLDALCDPKLSRYAEKNVIFVKKVDHMTLFPKCSVAVHHAGHGTCLAAPRGGIPSVVTPIHLDQTQNGKMLERKGLGICLQSFLLNTPEAIGQAMRKVINDPLMKQNCKEAALMMSQNDACERIGDYVKKWMEEMVLTGEQMKKNDAYWQDILGKERNPPKRCCCTIS